MISIDCKISNTCLFTVEITSAYDFKRKVVILCKHAYVVIQVYISGSQNTLNSVIRNSIKSYSEINLVIATTKKIITRKA